MSAGQVLLRKSIAVWRRTKRINNFGDGSLVKKLYTWSSCIDLVYQMENDTISYQKEKVCCLWLENVTFVYVLYLSECYSLRGF